MTEGGYKITDILSVIASSASGTKLRMIIDIELFMHEGKDFHDAVRM